MRYAGASRADSTARSSASATLMKPDESGNRPSDHPEERTVSFWDLAESADSTRLLRKILGAEARGWIRYRTVVRHGFETHNLLLAEALHGRLGSPGEQAALAAQALGLAPRSESVPALIEAAQRWEATGLPPGPALRSLGQIGTSDAGAFLEATCRRYLQAGQSGLLASAAEGLVWFGEARCLPLLLRLFHESAGLPPAGEGEVRHIQMTAAIGLLRLDDPFGQAHLARALRGELGRDAQGLGLRLLHRLAPDARACIPDLCELVLEGPAFMVPPALDLLTVMTGGAVPYEPEPHRGPGLEREMAASLVRDVLDNADLTSPPVRVRAALLHGRLGENSPSEELVREALADSFGLSRLARETLASEPFTGDAGVQDLFAAGDIDDWDREGRDRYRSPPGSHRACPGRQRAGTGAVPPLPLAGCPLAPTRVAHGGRRGARRGAGGRKPISRDGHGAGVAPEAGAGRPGS